MRRKWLTIGLALCMTLLLSVAAYASDSGSFTITWNYPDPTDGSDQTYIEVIHDDEPFLHDGGSYEVWVNKDDLSDIFLPWERPTGDKTYVPVFTITWGDPAYCTQKVPYKHYIWMPNDYFLPEEVQGKDWVNKSDGSPFAEHPATKDETYVPLFTITWDPDNGDPVMTEQVKQGVTPSYGADNPAKSGATFNGWSLAPYPADRDETYTAQYTPVSSVSLDWCSSSTISFTVEASEPSTAYFALYDRNNRFRRVELRSLDAGTVTLRFSVYNDYYYGARYAKLMLLDDAGAPLCANAEAVLRAPASGGGGGG